MRRTVHAHQLPQRGYKVLILSYWNMGQPPCSKKEDQAKYHGSSAEPDVAAMSYMVDTSGGRQAHADVSQHLALQSGPIRNRLETR
jgi:hypothetical protein